MPRASLIGEGRVLAMLVAAAGAILTVVDAVILWTLRGLHAMDYTGMAPSDPAAVDAENVWETRVAVLLLFVGVAVMLAGLVCARRRG